ncbi:alanine racemase [Cryptosporangium japonicum]|uniref:Type III PLP-dependent enzyme n=1 Tax=Cryptosporangium japonicum TaxID=80872 RepID=A0ABP3EW78_9ACTN
MELPRSFEGTDALPVDAVPAAVRAAALASRNSGEPVGGYLYDLAAATERAEGLVRALPSRAKVFYAVKANSFPPLLTTLAETVHGFEVASVSEARLAIAAAGKAGKIPRLVVSGPAKNPTLLAGLLALDSPAGHELTINVESILELHRLSRAVSGHAPGREVPVALRVNPERSPVTIDHSHGLTMGGLPSPFGIPEPQIPAAVRALGSLPGVRFVGFHLHAVSGNMDADLHAQYVRGAIDWAVRTADAHGLELRTIDVGGGLGIPFEPGPEFDVAAFGASIDVPDGVELVLEPGRWMAGPVGWYATEVVDVKHAYGEVFVVVRGGINHFQLPTSWEIRHNFAVVPIDDWPIGLPRPTAERARVTVSGELCTPEDVLARDVTVDRVRAGDLLIFPNAGAYGFEFAMPAFLGQPPAWRTALTRPAIPRPASRVDDLSNFR